MKRRYFVLLTVLCSILLFNPKHSQKNEAIASTVGVSDELKAAFEELNKLAEQMTQTALELKENVEKYRDPQQWDARDIVDFYDALGDAVSGINSLDDDVRDAMSEFQKLLKKSPLPDIVIERHLEFVIKYEENYEKFNELYDEIRLLRMDLLSKKSGVAITEDMLIKDETARLEIKKDIEKLEEYLRKWYVSDKIEKREPEPDDPKPWQNIFMKERKPKTGGKHIPMYQMSQAAAPIFAPVPPDTGQIMGIEVLPEDTLQTIDTEMIPELTELAATLGNDPIEIYEWVLNNIYYQPYYGSAKGAAKTYYDRAGNDFDTASLLIALLRESNIPCRYVYGTIKLTPAQANNIFGTDSAVTAATILAKGGTPARWDGFDLLIEHCWVEVYVPYDHYCGTGDRPSGKIWVPLDPSFKTYSYTDAMRVAEEAIPDWKVFWKDFFENGVTEKTAAEIYKDTVAEYVEANYPGKTIDDVPITRAIVPENLGILPLSMPYEVESVHDEYSEIHDTLRHKVRFKVFRSGEESPFDSVLNLSEVLTQRITLGWIGATQDDQAIIDSFGGLLATPSYLVDIKPVLLLNGDVKATGNPVNVCDPLNVTRHSILPTGVNIDTTGDEYLDQFGGSETFDIWAGQPVGLAHGFQGYSDEYMQKQFDILQANSQSLNYDDVFGQIAYINGISWYKGTFEAHKLACELRHVSYWTNIAHYAVALIDNSASYFMGGLTSIAPRSFVTDGGISWTMISFSTDSVGEDFHKVIACSDSQLEGFPYRDLYGIPPVSAVTLIQHAYEIGRGEEVINEWTDDDPETGVTIKTPNVSYYNWVGKGIIGSYLNKRGYLISGGLNGGAGAVSFGAYFKDTGKFLNEIYLQAGDPNASVVGYVIDIIPEGVNVEVEIAATLEGVNIPAGDITKEHVNKKLKAYFKVGSKSAGTNLTLFAEYDITGISDIVGHYVGIVELRFVENDYSGTQDDIFTFDNGLGTVTDYLPSDEGDIYIPYSEEAVGWAFSDEIGGDEGVLQVWKDGEPLDIDTFEDLWKEGIGQYTIYYLGSDGNTYWVKVNMAEQAPPNHFLFTEFPTYGTRNPDENGNMFMSYEDFIATPSTWTFDSASFSIVNIHNITDGVFEGTALDTTDIDTPGEYVIYYTYNDITYWVRLWLTFNVEFVGYTYDTTLASFNTNLNSIHNIDGEPVIITKGGFLRSENTITVRTNTSTQLTTLPRVYIKNHLPSISTTIYLDLQYNAASSGSGNHIYENTFTVYDSSRTEGLIAPYIMIEDEDPLKVSSSIQAPPIEFSDFVEIDIAEVAAADIAWFMKGTEKFNNRNYGGAFIESFVNIHNFTTQGPDFSSNPKTPGYHVSVSKYSCDIVADEQSVFGADWGKWMRQFGGRADILRVMAHGIPGELTIGATLSGDSSCNQKFESSSSSSSYDGIFDLNDIYDSPYFDLDWLILHSCSAIQGNHAEEWADILLYGAPYAFKNPIHGIIGFRGSAPSVEPEDQGEINIQDTPELLEDFANYLNVLNNSVKDAWFQASIDMRHLRLFLDDHLSSSHNTGVIVREDNEDDVIPQTCFECHSDSRMFDTGTSITKKYYYLEYRGFDTNETTDDGNAICQIACYKIVEGDPMQDGGAMPEPIALDLDTDGDGVIDIEGVIINENDIDIECDEAQGWERYPTGQ
jgi:transglutaminase-like putative cysteine protease